ncbi:MAG: cyclic-di-AMP receptor [Bacillota bacterium]|nr:cyclic-di-AMP receptor [Bacillota bacterium]
MKLVIAVVQDKDSGRLLSALVDRGHSATKLASTGGFLREGNTTLLIGVEDDEVEEVLHLIGEVCQSRQQMVNPMPPAAGQVESYMTYPVEVTVGGATVFVLDVEHFAKF